MLGVSRWTIYRRIKEFDLEHFTQFSSISDHLDNVVKDYNGRHGATAGQTYIAGFVRSLGLRVQRQNS